MQQGEVLVGGHDVRDVTQDSLGRQIAMVLQEPFLFTGSVLENIRYRKADATRERGRSRRRRRSARTTSSCACRRATTPSSASAAAASRSASASCVSFARALVADAQILVLDEATASVDSYTEMLIQKALVRLLEGRTGLVIAHRLATIRDADRIIVLQRRPGGRDRRPTPS